MTASFMKKLLLALPLAAIGIWLAWQFGAALNSSHASLTIAAQRLLAGGTITGDFNEPNPPLSFLMYVLPVLMTKYLFVPAYYAPYVFGLLCLAASVLAIIKILKYWPRPDDDAKTVFVFAFIIANTLLTSSVYFYFGERDHIVIMALYPFLLVQLALTWRYELPKALTWGVLIPCAAAILIKPQYGLLPVMALVHRMAAQKRFFSIIRDADFIALAGAVIVYGAVIVFLFPDYLSSSLPEYMLFYATARNPQTPFVWLLYTALLICVAGFGMIWGVPREKMKLALVCHFAAFVCLLLFLLQMKGFYYHLIPAFVFLLTGIGLQAHEIFGRYLGRKWFTAPAAVAVILIAAGALRSEGTTSLRHADYARTPLARLVKDCAPGCSYLVFGEDLEKTSQIQIYTGATYASRFPVLWWLTGMVAGLDANPGDPALLKLKATYARYVALDIQRYRPAVMAFASNLTISGHKNFDLVSFFSVDPLFRQELKKYKRVAPLQDNRKNYFRQPVPEDDVPLVYDVYRRKN